LAQGLAVEGFDQESTLEIARDFASTDEDFQLFYPLFFILANGHYGLIGAEIWGQDLIVFG
jgi:hypothetical protein